MLTWFFVFVLKLINMENSNLDSLSFHSLNITEIDDESIVNLSSDFPRMKNVDINSCSYYSSSKFNKIFENSGIDASDSLNDPW